MLMTDVIGDAPHRIARRLDGVMDTMLPGLFAEIPTPVSDGSCVSLASGHEGPCTVFKTALTCDVLQVTMCMLMGHSPDRLSESDVTGDDIRRQDQVTIMDLVETSLGAATGRQVCGEI